MPEPYNPESLDEINSISASPDIKEFVTKLSSEIEESETDRTEWKTRQDDYDRKRYGIRTRKTFPWVGAANFVLPQIDSDINRLKPSYINLAFGVSPIVNFEPYGPEDVEPAKKREMLFDWRMRTQVKPFKEYCLGVDYALSRGFTLFKISWKFQTRKYTKILDLANLDTQIVDALFMPEVTDQVLAQIIAEEMKPDLTFEENVKEIKDTVADFRNGKTTFEMEFIEKAENRAELRACDPREDVTFPIGTTDIQQARFIDYKFWINKNAIKIDMESGKYDSFDDYAIDSWATKSYELSSNDSLKAARDGVTMNKRHNDLILMHETCTWYDIDGDGIDERVLITYPDSDPNSILRFIEIPYDHGQFPYVVVRREYNDAEIMSSRGIPALDDDFQTGISTLFNQDIDSGTIMTTPTVVARKNSVKNLRNLRYIPGQVVETENGTADYQVVQNANLGQGNKFNSMQYLKSWANDRIGNMTAAISQPNNPSGQGQQGQKTAKEVGAIEGMASQLQAMDLMVWQDQMADVYYQIDALYEQFGDEVETLFITNGPKMDVSRQEIQGKFNMVPNGRLDNSNPVLRANKSISIFQMFNGDPYFKQDELRKKVIQDLDFRDASKIMYSQEEMLANQQAQAHAQAVEKASTLQEQLGIRKISDALELEKAANMKKLGAKLTDSVLSTDKGF